MKRNAIWASVLFTFGAAAVSTVISQVITSVVGLIAGVNEPLMWPIMLFYILWFVLFLGISYWTFSRLIKTKAARLTFWILSFVILLFRVLELILPLLNTA